jgi:Alpha/beta hydrolase family
MSELGNLTRSPQSAPASGLEFLVEPPQANVVVAFVHGLGGHHLKSWGAVGQPGAFMRRLQADYPRAAVATYNYTSDLKAIRSDESLTLQALARAWAHAIREPLLAQFQTVVIIAHCMGGLMTTTAVCSLIAGFGDHNGGALRGKRVVLFLLDAPHDLPVEDPDPWLAGFFNALKLAPAALRAQAAFWRNRVLADLNMPLTVEAFAMTSEPASWVTPLHPDADLPPDRVCRAQLPHEELTKVPARGAFIAYDFVLARLRELDRSDVETCHGS